MHRTLRSAAVVAATAVVVAGCSSSTEPAAQRGTPVPASPSATPTAQMAAHNVEAPMQDVPWSEVGPGWMLAMWNAASPTNSGDDFNPEEPTPYDAETTLYLVNPEAAATRSRRSQRRARTVRCPYWPTGRATEAAHCSIGRVTT